MEIAFSLGSNLGDRLTLLQQARDGILGEASAQLEAQSPVYETEPVGVRPEHASLPFLNAVLVIESDASAAVWLKNLAAIEQRLGRVRMADRYAPRTIDIDILYVGDQCIGSGGLVVPHARWAERRFVVQPLADVRPELVLPGQDLSVREILRTLSGDASLELLTKDW